MKPIDDEAPTRFRQVVRSRLDAQDEATAVRRAAPALSPPAREPVSSADTATMSRCAQATSSPPHAETVVRPLRPHAATAPSARRAPRSPRRELALRCGLAIVVTTVALGVALASTAVVPAHGPQLAEDLASVTPVTPDATDTPTPTSGVAPAPSSASTTDPGAPTAPPAAATTTASAESVPPGPAAPDPAAPTVPIAQPAEAARLLATGAYAPALDAYRTLARSEPDTPVYALIARVLARNLGARCERSPTAGDPTCSTHDAHTQDTHAASPTSPSSR